MDLPRRVDVDPGSPAHVAVAQQALKPMSVDAGAQKQRRSRVAQIVEAHWQWDRLRPERAASRLREGLGSAFGSLEALRAARARAWLAGLPCRDGSQHSPEAPVALLFVGLALLGRTSGRRASGGNGITGEGFGQLYEEARLGYDWDGLPQEGTSSPIPPALCNQRIQVSGFPLRRRSLRDIERGPKGDRFH